MSALMAKSILTTVVLVLAIAQAITGARLRGYLKPLPLPIQPLRSWHRWSGDATLILTITVAIVCVASLGFSMYSSRVMLHAVLGTLAALIMILKAIIARRFRSYLRHTLLLGTIAGFSLLGCWVASALWYFWWIL